MSAQNLSDNTLGYGDGALALARELKQTLYLIARQAELGNADSMLGIEQQANQALRFIDSFVLSAQTEYGQVQLDLQPLAIGAVLHDAAYALQHTNDQKTIDITVQAKAQGAVMTHKKALEGFVVAAGQSVAALADSDNDQLILRSFAERNGSIGVGVFAEGTSLSSEDLERAIVLSEKASAPLSLRSSQSGLLLKIADSLARSLGGELTVKRMGNVRGLVTTLPQSNQLALV